MIDVRGIRYGLALGILGFTIVLAGCGYRSPFKDTDLATLSDPCRETKTTVRFSLEPNSWLANIEVTTPGEIWSHEEWPVGFSLAVYATDGRFVAGCVDQQWGHFNEGDRFGVRCELATDYLPVFGGGPASAPTPSTLVSGQAYQAILGVDAAKCVALQRPWRVRLHSGYETGLHYVKIRRAVRRFRGWPN